MADDPKPRTSEINGPLWSGRAEDWANIQEGTARPVYEAVIERTGLGSGTRLLDVGCGAGMAMQLATGRGANVSGIDAAETLLDIARSRVPGADIRQGDIEALPFADQTFDVVTGFNSFQYAGNPREALIEARRVTKPDGSIVIVTWGDPNGMEATALLGALRPLMPPPPPGAPGPFALSEESALRQFASDAGLKTVEVFDVNCPLTYPDEATALRGWSSSGNAVRVMETTSEQAVADALTGAIAPFRQPDGSVSISGSYRCLLAHP